MKLAVFAYSRRGQQTARRVLTALAAGEAQAYTPARISAPDFLPLPSPAAPLYAALFSGMDALVFVGACGIAVRAIAPNVRSKATDPAVLCVDELAGFVIPLLSGHIGGANALARQLAAALDAVCVVTTATDINGRFSVDAWAARQGHVLDSLADARAVSAAILERELPLCSDLPIETPLPAGLYAGEGGDLGIYVGWDTRRRPFDTTLRIIPRALRLGLGCRRGVSADALRDAVETVLAEHGIDRRAIRAAASIDLKRDEAGLLAYCARMGWPLRFYTPEELRAVPGEFTASDFVSSVTGVDNVCERAALAGAARLLVRKTSRGGVTVAVAAENVGLRF